MSYEFRVNFTGLCLHYLPNVSVPNMCLKNNQSPEMPCDQPQVLVVASGQEDDNHGHDDPENHEHEHESHKHEAFFAFRTRDLKESITSGGEQVRYVVDRYGNQVGYVDLRKGYTISLQLDSKDQEIVSRGLEVATGRNRQRATPILNGKEHIEWLPSLYAAHKDIKGLKKECFKDNSLSGPDPLVWSRFPLRFGKLRASRLGRRKNGRFSLWKMYPVESHRYYSCLDWEQLHALADRVTLSIENLKYHVMVRLEPHDSAVGPPIEMTFRSDNKKIDVAVSNMPKTPPPLGGGLYHFKHFYDLVTWHCDEPPAILPIPVEPADTSMKPEDYDGSDDRTGGAGGGLFCPSSSFP